MRQTDWLRECLDRRGLTMHQEKRGAGRDRVQLWEKASYRPLYCAPVVRLIHALVEKSLPESLS